MKKVILGIVATLVIVLVANAQQKLTLVNTIIDNSTSSEPVSAVNLPLRIKNINDTTYAYFGNMVSSNGNKYYLVQINTLNSEGNIVRTKSIEVDFATDQSSNATITDVISGSNAAIYVVQDVIINFQNSVSIKKFILNANTQEYELDANFGNSTSGVYTSGTGFKNAKGYLNSESKIVFFSINTNDIYRHELTTNGSNATSKIIVDNRKDFFNDFDTISAISDILVLPDNSVIIADETRLRQGIPPTLSWASINRIVKVDAQGNLINSFGEYGIRYMENWQFFGGLYPINGAVFINKLYLDSNAILVCGSSGDPYSPSSRKGVISKLDTVNGYELGWAIGGRFSPTNSEIGYDRYFFYDIRKTNDNKYLVMGNGLKTGSSIISSLILAVDRTSGNIQISMGDSGRIFESTTLISIHDSRIIVPASGSLTDTRIVVMGTANSSIQNMGSFFPTTTISSLKWDMGGSTSVSSIFSPKIQLYPNPANSVINIQLHEAATAQIYSIEGKLLISSENNPQHIIDISSLPSGMYIVRSNNITTKFIKE